MCKHILIKVSPAILLSALLLTGCSDNQAETNSAKQPLTTVAMDIAKSVSSLFHSLPDVVTIPDNSSYTTSSSDPAQEQDAVVPDIQPDSSTEIGQDEEPPLEEQVREPIMNAPITSEEYVPIRSDFSYYGLLDVAGTTIPLYEPDGIYDSQTIVNAKNSAALINGFIIADHNNQDFRCLATVQLGDAAVISNDQITQAFQCAEIVSGTNHDGVVTTDDGRDVCVDMNEYDLIMYTCAPTPRDRKAVLITCWTTI